MKSFFFLLVLLLPGPLLIQAQKITVDSKNDSLIKTNFVQNGRYSSRVYTMDNKELSNSDLKSILRTYPKSADELKKYYGQRRTVLIMLSVFVASTTVGVIQVKNKQNISGSAFSKAPIPFSISIGALVSSIIIGASNNHIHKAIKAYNNRL